MFWVFLISSWQNQAQQQIRLAALELKKGQKELVNRGFHQRLVYFSKSPNWHAGSFPFSQFLLIWCRMISSIKNCFSFFFLYQPDNDLFTTHTTFCTKDVLRYNSRKIIFPNCHPRCKGQCEHQWLCATKVRIKCTIISKMRYTFLFRQIHGLAKKLYI